MDLSCLLSDLSDLVWQASQEDGSWEELVCQVLDELTTDPTVEGAIENVSELLEAWRRETPSKGEG